MSRRISHMLSHGSTLRVCGASTMRSPSIKGFKRGSNLEKGSQGKILVLYQVSVFYGIIQGAACTCRPQLALRRLIV